MLFILLCALIASTSSAAVFTPLGDLPGGAFHSEATRISADGSTVVGWSMTANGREAFRWTREEGMMSLGMLLGGTESNALGVSGDGSVVSGFADNSDLPGLQAEAFRWTREEGMTPLGFLGGGSDSRARAVSADGNTIVGASRKADGTTEAFRWNRADGLAGLGDLPGGSQGSVAQNVSSDGNVVIGYGDSELGREAFWWSQEGGMIGLGDAEGGVFRSAAYDFMYDYLGEPWLAVGEVTDSAGTVAGYFGPDGTPGKIGGTTGELPSPSAAYGSVGAGPQSFVVGTTQSPDGPEAFVASTYGLLPVWKFASVVHGLDASISNWRLQTAVSAGKSSSDSFRYWSKNVTFVGTGTDEDGNTQAWLIDLGRFEHEDIPGAFGWQSGPAGLYQVASQGLVLDRAEGQSAPLESELLSPEFMFHSDMLAELSIGTSWHGDGGQLNIDLIESDDPDSPLFSVMFFQLSSLSGLPQSRSKQSVIDTSRVTTGTKYRLRFRYFDSNESGLSLGPVSLDSFSMAGVTFIVPGDTNGDAKVDIADLNNVRNNFGASGVGIVGDTNNDLQVNILDLNAVRNNFGIAVAQSANVCEPASWSLTSFAVFCCFASRRYGSKFGRPD